jgi:hypothetical protein
MCLLHNIVDMLPGTVLVAGYPATSVPVCGSGLESGAQLLFHDRMRLGTEGIMGSD